MCRAGGIPFAGRVLGETSSSRVGVLPSTPLNKEIGGTMEHSDGQDRQAEVTVLEWEQRKSFVGFTDDDALLLRALSPLSEAHADEVVEELYRQFLRFDETKAFFPDDATLNHVKAM